MGCGGSKKGEGKEPVKIKRKRPVTKEEILADDRTYFRGVKTILNSEIAAIYKCEDLFNSLPKGEKWCDTDFGPLTGSENDEQASKSLYYDKALPGMTRPEEIVWLYPKEYTSAARFMKDGASANDVKQGALGDCWVIGALSVLATRDALLRGFNVEIPADAEVTDELAHKMSSGVYPPLFHIYRKKGIYVFKFFKHQKWKYVITDLRIPCYKSSRTPVFGTCKDDSELWIPLIEKAFAKLHGNYESLISGGSEDALTDMTGLAAERIKLRDRGGKFPSKEVESSEWLWDRLLREYKNKTMMGCSATGGTEEEIVLNGVQTGVLNGHAYAILNIFELQLPETEEKTKLLRVRNPWGHTEWKGKWSDTSDEISTHAEPLMGYLSSLEVEEQFVPGEPDGSFLISFEDWRDVYTTLSFCIDFPDNWSGLRITDAWTKENSFGMPMSAEKYMAWAKNPQFKLTLDEASNIFLVLYQRDGRLEPGAKFPFKDFINPVNMTIMKQETEGQERVEVFKKENMVKTSTILEHREITLRYKLEPGTYFIVASTKNEGEVGKLYFNAYFEAPLSSVHISSVNKPGIKFRVIAEEREKYKKVNAGKKLLIKERLKSVMFESGEIEGKAAEFQNMMAGKEEEDMMM